MFSVDFDSLFLYLSSDAVNQVLAGFDDDLARGVGGIGVLQRDIDIVAQLDDLERRVHYVLPLGNIAVGELLAGEAQQANACQEQYAEFSFHG